MGTHGFQIDFVLSEFEINLLNRPNLIRLKPKYILLNQAKFKEDSVA